MTMRSTKMTLRYRWCGALALLLCALSAVSAPAGAAAAADKQKDAAIADMQRKLDESLQAIKALTERVRELEAKQAAAAPAVATPPPAGAAPAAAAVPAADAARIDATEQRVTQLEKADASRKSADGGLPLHGFADVGAGTHNPINPALKGFYVGNLDFYMAPRLGDRSRALFELNTEVGSDGAVDIDLERAQIGYQFSDETTVWLGRFHTPYGYINTALHHGSWVNNSLRRPRFLQFEDNGGIMPAHTVGLWANGAVHAGEGKLLYDLYGGNSQRIVGGGLDMRNAGSPQFSLMAGGRLAYQFNSGTLEGLTLGLHALTARINADLPLSTTRLRVYGGYADYDTDQWENVAEFYVFSNQDLSGVSGGHRSTAGFVQFGYRVPWGVPYARYERAVLEQTDPYFAALDGGGSYARAALGLRFDVDLRSALKLELANTRASDRARDRYNEGLVQYAIRF
jgi:hypothetical protein